MFHQRKSANLVTPRYEDGGIFKTEVVHISVEAIPQFGRNQRGDIIIKGFVLGDGAIDLVLAGRRKKQAAMLQDLIQSQWTKACAKARFQGEQAAVEDFRWTIQVEGSWRARFKRDEHGIETRTHQLYAARWAFKDHDCITVISGEPIAR